MRPTIDNLNDLVDFDSPFRIHPDGSLTFPGGVYAPDVLDEVVESDKWAPISGFSGQSSYSGPVMHNSEYLGCGMARYVLENPATYVTVPCYWSATECDFCGSALSHDGNCTDSDCENYGEEPFETSSIEGWMLLRLKGSEEELLEED